MLDVREHRAPVGRGDDTRYLAATGPGEKAPDLARRNVGGEHLVVTHALVVAFMHRAGRYVRLYPQYPAVVEPQSVRAAERVALDVAALRRVGMLRIACQHKNVPLEIQRRGLAALLAPADNMAEGIVGARIGGVRAGILRHAATRAVGQRAIHFFRCRMHCNPFGPIHLGRVECIRCGAGTDQHVRLIFKPAGSIQTVLAEHQVYPFPAAVFVKLRDIQRAVVEQVAVGAALVGLPRIA